MNYSKYITYLILCFGLIISLESFGQEEERPDPNSMEFSDEENEAAQNFLNNLYETGIGHVGDSVVLNEEAKLLLSSEEYRKLMYPPQYNWETVRALMDKKALKQAFWYMINIYPASDENKDLVLKMLVPFDTYIEMDKVMISTYYTYISFDPEVSKIEDGVITETLRPDIAEEKLKHTEDIVKNILYYRDLRKNQ